MRKFMNRFISIFLISLAFGISSARAELVLEPVSAVSAIPAKKKISTFKDMRYQNVVRQQYDYSCGAAALGTLLKYGYGVSFPENELIRRMMVNADAKEVLENGFSMLDMKRFVESVGLRGHGFKIDAKALYRLKIPVIALMEVKGYRHFVVLKGADAGRVFISDPAMGNRVLRLDDFAKSWNGVVLAIVTDTTLPADAPLMNGKQSFALKQRQQSLLRATTDAPQVEFGLMKADLL
jgi:uncharacterized protein